MKHNFLTTINQRRSVYSLSNQSPISDTEIEEMITSVINCTPSAFNSQSPCVVLLLHDQHKKLWNITLETLKKITSPEAFEETHKKISHSFLSGYGTVLFFEDSDITKGLQEQIPFYADKFPYWAQQSNGILQFAIWTALADAGLGASLQHYNPIIDEEVADEWQIPKSWVLIAQMPFGTPTEKTAERSHRPIEDRLLIKK